MQFWPAWNSLCWTHRGLPAFDSGALEVMACSTIAGRGSGFVVVAAICLSVLCMFVWGVHVHMYAYVSGGQRTTSDVILRNVVRVLWDRFFHETEAYQFGWTGWPESPRDPCVASSRTGIVDHHTRHFYVSSEDQTQDFLLLRATTLATELSTQSLLLSF